MNSLHTLTFGILLAAFPACSDDTSDDAATGGSAGAGSAGKSGGSAGKGASTGGKGATGGAAGTSAGEAGTDNGAGEAGMSQGGSAGEAGAGSDTSAGATGGAAGTAGTAGTAGSAGSGTGACNDLTIDAPLVHPVTVEGGPGSMRPLPMGGKITNGTYFLTKYEVYGSDANPGDYEVVMKISGSDLELAQIVGGTETRASFDLVTGAKSATSFAASTTCPGPGQSLAYDTYTATSDELQLFDDEKVVTLTLQ